jgi:PhnB protein
MPKRSQNPGNNGPNKIDLKKVEQLNRAVDALLARTNSNAPKLDADVAPLLNLAASLRQLPRGEFKAKLKAELLQPKKDKSEAKKNEAKKKAGRKIMSTVAEPVAAVHTTAAPRIVFKDTAKAIEFYKAAFGAEEVMRFATPTGIPHAEIRVGDSTLLLADEWPEGGRFSAETLGHSPIHLSLQVADVDSFAARAVAAGMTNLIPIRDQFYGRREGTFIDPFGYTWSISTVTEEMSLEEMHRRMQGLTAGPEGGKMPEADKLPAVEPIPRGYRTVTPYLVAQDSVGVVEFLKRTFGAEEKFRAVGGAGGYHVEVKIEDSMLMIGGGGEGVSWKGDPVLGAFHVYVRDCDATYKLALQAGATSLQEPSDQEYGERTASVIDAAGNHWYIATFIDTGFKYGDAPTVQPFMHPLRAEPVINFLKRAFGAEEMGRYTDPFGVMHHTTLKIGDAQLEMGEAHGPYQPMKSMFYLYVPNSDVVYRRAIAAGATSIHEPADQPYGDRVGAVKDIFGNQWYIGTHVKDVAH